ncbi:MAG: HD domain-containing protein [Muribaculaceae bacterium]|nr:HD domain-containing protein [Muribaculaceae bacterium]MCM1439672.1 HD domain-containing protein [Roseburia sp.]
MKEEFEELFRKYIHRPGAEQLLDWLKGQTDFFTAPASTKHHLAYPGGLVEHSVNVFKELCRVIDRDSGETMETAAICGLLHDVCKANYYAKSFRPDPDGGGFGYAVNDRFPFGHGEKSVYLISRFIRLTDEEALAIRWHMGAFDEAVRGGSRGLNEAMKLYRLVYELHAADMRATHIVEGGE